MDLEKNKTLERKFRDAELRRADIELLKVQDSDPGATGNVGDWRTYRKALRAWPNDENFPDPSYRPVAPDFTSSGVVGETGVKKPDGQE